MSKKESPDVRELLGEVESLLETRLKEMGVYRMPYETTLVFDFEKDGARHLFKFSIAGCSFYDIRKKAEKLQREIWNLHFEGKSPF